MRFVYLIIMCLYFIVLAHL